jgi:inositol phosphorylceramide glucuronosyltransferase 1
MKNRGLLSAVTLLMVALAALSTDGATVASDEAYVTLLYGDQFVLGARVLGKSIRDTGTTKDLVALVSDGVSTYAQELLKVIHQLDNSVV